MPRPELGDRLKAILQEEEDRKFSPEYVAHLHSRKWAELRKLALEAAKYCCQLCNSSQSLHVHHRTYARLGNELLSDLTVMCDGCHASFHNCTRVIPNVKPVVTVGKKPKFKHNSKRPHPTMTTFQSREIYIIQLTRYNPNDDRSFEKFDVRPNAVVALQAVEPRIGLEKRTRLKLFDGEWVEVWESPEVVRQKLGLKVDEG